MPIHADTVRIASFNVSFDRTAQGQLAKQMSQPGMVQINNIAEIIQRTAPDVILLNEFDHDGSATETQAVADFQKNYLGVSQHGSTPIHYPYFYIAPTNTGLKRENAKGDYGFGRYHGQYGFIILSKYPLETSKLRSYQQFLWKDMPNAALPKNQDGSSFIAPSSLADFRLSSKNHTDLPVNVNGTLIHLLAMHPTPPVFDGPEDLNGRRNHDEIRLFADYIDPKKSAYLVSDQGSKGGLSDEAKFVILGDLNADPIAGDSYQKAILQLLTSPKINPDFYQGSLVPTSKGGLAYSKTRTPNQPRNSLTSAFGLRVDYALPSNNLVALSSGVFWPAKNSTERYLVEDKKGNQGKKVSSDHRLVWVDLEIK